MSYNPIDVDPKELVSDSLHDVFAEDLKALDDYFILASLVIDEENILTGTIVGVEFGENPKLDFKVSTRSCFEFIGKKLLRQCKVKDLFLNFANDSVRVSGPFLITSFKIIEMDYENKACVLAVDLFKDRP